MDVVLDALAAYLSGPPPGRPDLAKVAWILGDPGLGSPGAMPWGYVTPAEDVVEQRSTQVDFDQYRVEIVLVDDLRAYGDPRPVVGTGYFEQPGYRELMRYAELVRGALRANITLNGAVATSALRSIRYTPIAIDNRWFRAARLVWSAGERRSR